MLHIAGGIILAFLFFAFLPLIFSLLGGLLFLLIAIALICVFAVLIMEEPMLGMALAILVVISATLLSLLELFSSLEIGSLLGRRWKFIFGVDQKTISRPKFSAQKGALKNTLGKIKLSLKPAFTDTQFIQKQRALGANLREREAISNAMETRWHGEVSEHNAQKRNYAKGFLESKSHSFKRQVAEKCSAYIDEGLINIELLESNGATAVIELSDRKGKLFAKAWLTVEEKSPSRATLNVDITDSSGGHLLIGGSYSSGLSALKLATRKHIKESTL